MKKKFLCQVIVLCLAVLTGCSWQSANQTKKGIFSGKKEAEFRTIGIKGKNVRSIYVLNSTENEIRGIHFRESGKKSWGKNLLTKGDKIAKDEKVQIFPGKDKSWKYVDVKINYKKIKIKFYRRF